MRTAKSCGPGAPMLALSFCGVTSVEVTVAKKPGHRGEHEVSRKPLRRESRIASAEPVCSCAHSSVHFAHETAGAARIRLSLRPLQCKSGEISENLGRIAPRERAITPTLCRHRPRKRTIQYPRDCSDRTEAICDLAPQGKNGLLTWGMYVSRMRGHLFVRLRPPLRPDRGLCRMARADQVKAGPLGPPRSGLALS
jgi:hypothetical protein